MAGENPIILALEEQLGCYRKLAKLAEAQREHVQQSHTEALLNVLRIRQEMLDQLGRIEAAIAPAKQRWTGFLGELSPEVKSHAEELVAESRKLLEKITASDRTDVLALQQRKISLARQIGKTGNARQINRTYSTAAYGQKASRMNITQ